MRLLISAWLLGSCLLPACSSSEPGDSAGPPAEPIAKVCGEPDEYLYPRDFAEIAGCTTWRGNIHISDTQNQDLVELASLRVVEGWLALFRNQELSSLRGLDEVRSVGGLSVRWSTRLPSLKELSRLEEIRGELHIDLNPLIEDLEGLEGIVEAGAVRITDNDELSTLKGLDRLERVTGDLTIARNPKLPTSLASDFAAAVTASGTVDLSDNGPN